MKKKLCMLFACTGVALAPWLEGFAAQAPDIDIRIWPEIGDPADIDYAFVWKPPTGVFAGLPNLRAIFSLGAGIETLLTPGLLPDSVPLVRMVDPGLAVGMNEFVVMRVLHYHRRMHEHAAFQAEAVWMPLVPKLPEDRVVGIMGLGQLGGLCARTLVSFGFPLRGWSRTQRQIDGVQTFHGQHGLAPFLQDTEILVCLLPLTQDTSGLVNGHLLSQLPRGACLINTARGAHVVDTDLLSAIESGQIGAATLDVFMQEPLPPSHPYWAHPKVTVVPHCSAITQPKTAIRTLLSNLRCHDAGGMLENQVDLARGY